MATRAAGTQFCAELFCITATSTLFAVAGASALASPLGIAPVAAGLFTGSFSATLVPTFMLGSEVSGKNPVIAVITALFAATLIGTAVTLAVGYTFTVSVGVVLGMVGMLATLLGLLFQEVVCNGC